MRKVFMNNDNNTKSLPPYLLIAISALVLGLSRYPGSMGIFAFIAFIPLFRFFDSGKKNSLELMRGAAIFSNQYPYCISLDRISNPTWCPWNNNSLCSLLLGSICLFKSSVAEERMDKMAWIHLNLAFF